MTRSLHMAAIYARISSDDGSALGVGRQVKDCTELAERRGWNVSETYVDNDVSASSGKARPQYEALTAAISDGRVDALVVWDIDRLTRTPSELERFIGLADAHGIALASVGGEVDLATPQGRLTARIKGSVARHEVEQSSRRLKRKFLERAESGKSHGKVAYGYVRRPVIGDAGTVTGYTEHIDPDQARVIRDSAKRLLSGESLRSVVAEVNATGSTTPRGLPWTGTTLRQVLLRERNAGRRVHQGQVIGRGDWPAILDDDTFDRLVALLRDPRRRTSSSGPEIKYLLSGIADCGRCGSKLRGTKARQNGTKHQPRAYRCDTCYRLRRKADDVEAVVESLMVARLSEPDAAGLFGGDPDAVREATNQKQADVARLELAADKYAAGTIDGATLERIAATLRPKIAAAGAIVRANAPAPGLVDMAGPDAGAAWADASIERRRAIITLLVTITVLPSGPGQSFDPDHVRVEWKS